MAASKLLAIASVGFIVGCSDAMSPFDDIDVRIVGVTAPTRDNYAIVSFTVTNMSSHAVYLARCGDRLMISVERQAGVMWLEYSGDACEAIYPMSPVSLEPGATVQGTRSIGDAGSFRLNVGIASAPDAQQDWTSVTSDAFGVQ